MSWSATADTDNYTVYFSTDNSSFTAISPVITGTSYTHTGRTANTTYYYYVTSNNVYGSSGESNRANATTPAAPTITFIITNYTPNEGDSGTGIYTIVANSSQRASTDTTITLGFGGTATNTTDYTVDSTTITISDNETSGLLV